MTDNEIIKNLENAAEWFSEHGRNTNTAIIEICKESVALINRQKAEIERLKNDLHACTKEVIRSHEIDRNKAIREFAERLKDMHKHNTTSVVSLVTIFDDINNLVKEMTEG